MTTFRLALLPAVVAVLTASIHLSGQTGPTAAQLPAPSGPFGSVRAAYDWTDSSRRDVHSLDGVTSRRLMVHVWDSHSKCRPRGAPPCTSRNFSAVQKALPKAALEGLFRPAPVLADRTVRPSGNTCTRARLCQRVRRDFPPSSFPMASHSEFALTAEFQDLVSHGYVVAAIDHTYDADSRCFPTAALSHTRGRVEHRIREAKWIRFVCQDAAQRFLGTRYSVLSVSSLLDRTLSPEDPSAGRLDLQRIGALVIRWED